MITGILSSVTSNIKTYLILFIFIALLSVLGYQYFKIKSLTTELDITKKELIISEYKNNTLYSEIEKQNRIIKEEKKKAEDIINNIMVDDSIITSDKKSDVKNAEEGIKWLKEHSSDF